MVKRILHKSKKSHRFLGKQPVKLLLFTCCICLYCLPISAQLYQHPFMANFPSYYDLNVITAESVSTLVTDVTATFPDGSSANMTRGDVIARSSLSNTFTVTWKALMEVTQNVINQRITIVTSIDQLTQKEKYYETAYTKAADLIIYGVDANGAKHSIAQKNSVAQGGTVTLNSDELALLKKYGKMQVVATLSSSDSFTASGVMSASKVNLVDPSSISITTSTPPSGTIYYNFEQAWAPTPTISNSTTATSSISGESDTKISGLQEQGGKASDHALNISESGSGVVTLSQCNLTNLLLTLSNVDFSCQNITGMQLQDAGGTVRKTFTAGVDFNTVGTNQINLSLANVLDIQDNDKIYIALTNSCTTNHESDYYITLSTEGNNGTPPYVYYNRDLYPDATNKIAVSLTQKAGTKWCDSSTAYYFTISGTNGYTNINPTGSTTFSSGVYTTPKGNQITYTADYFKCKTSLTYNLPATNQPKTPQISDVQYCNGGTVSLAINNPADYSTETFRLLFGGTEKVSWQTAKTFSGLSLGAVGSAVALVEANNGECVTQSNSATIYSRQQPVKPTVSGNRYYYSSEGETTTSITHNNAEAGITYNIYKDGSSTPSDTWTGANHTMSLSAGSYRLAATNGTGNCSEETSFTVTAKDLNIGSGWTTSAISFCQLDGTKDLNSFVSFNSINSINFSSTTGLSLTSAGSVDPNASTPGNYVVTATVKKDYITKTFNKNVVIKQKASSVNVTLNNASTIACDLSNPNASVTADNGSYTYVWYKNGTVVTGATVATASIPSTKADGLTTIYTIPYTSEGCAGAQSNTVSFTKKYVEANLSFTTGTASYCQTPAAGTTDIASELTGSDKTAVVNSQSGYTWTMTPSGSGLKMTGSVIDLNTSAAGDYTVTMTISKDGCSKTLIKAVTIKQRPAAVTVTLNNASTITCDTSNPDASLTADDDSYNYAWYKNGTLVSGITAQNASIPATKADGTVSIYAIPTTIDGCVGAQSNSVSFKKEYLEADIKVAACLSNCQEVEDKISPIADLFIDLDGADKNDIISKNGYTWTLDAPGLFLASDGHSVDTYKCLPGYYTPYFTYTNSAGCSNKLKLIYNILPKASPVTITLNNASTITCDTSNPDASLTADNSNYTYVWYKRSGVVSGLKTQSVNIPITKADGTVSISAIPYLHYNVTYFNGLCNTTIEGDCPGPRSNIISVTKKYVEADVAFSTGTTSYCQKTGGTTDIFTELSGTDKVAVTNSQSGYTWALSASGSGLKVTGSTINLETSIAGDYTVYFTISKDGCSKTLTKNVTILAKPADFTISQTNPTDFSCNKLNAEVAASVTGYTYKWYKGVFEMGSGQTNSIPVDKTDVTTASRTVYAIGTGANGCSTNPSASLILPQKLYLEADLSISSGTASLCQSPVVGTNADIFDFLSGADKLAVTTNQHYTWSVSAPGLTLDASGHAIDLFNSAAGNYTLSFTYTNDGGCSKTLTKSVTIKQRPAAVTVTLNNASTITCDLTSPAASVTADNGSYTYVWYKNGSVVSGVTAQTVSIPSAKSDGLTSIYVVPTNSEGCVGAQSNSVSFTKKYVEADLAFTTGVSQNCQTIGQLLDIRTLLSGSDKDKVMNSQDAYTWDLGYSATGLLFTDTPNSIINLEKSYAQTYTASLNIHRDGCSKTLTKEIKIKPRPIDISVMILNGDGISCNTDDVKFMASVSQYTYSWYKNGSILAEKINNLTLPMTKSDGIVNVYAVPFLDGCSGVQSNTVTTKKLYIDTDLAFTTGTASYCQKLATTLDLFTLISGTDKLNIVNKQSGWGWSFATNSPDLLINGSSVDLEKSQPGTYTVTLTLTKDGCSKTLTKVVVIKEKPTTVTLSLQNATTIECDLSNPNAQVLADDANYTYAWFKNGTLLSSMTTASVSIPVSKSDGLTSIYAIPSLDGCVGEATAPVSLTKRYITADVAFSTGVSSFCQKTGATTDIFSELSGTDKAAVVNSQSGYTWTISASGNGLKMSGSVIDLEKSEAGTYTLTLYISNNGCSKTLTKNVTILAAPADFSISQTNPTDFSCNKLNAEVAASVTGYNFVWFKNGALVNGLSTQKVSIPVTKADVTDASRTVCSIGIATNGCSTNPSASLILPQKLYLEADLSISSGTASLCQSPVAGTNADIFDFISGADKAAVTGKQHYTWLVNAAGLTLTSDGHSIDLYNSTPGTYNVSFTYTNDNGCSATLTKTVVIKAKASTVAIAQAMDVTCNKSNVTVVVSSNGSSNYSYAWYKNGSALTGTGSTISIPVSKADGLTNIYTVATTSEGCSGAQSNSLSVQKKYVDANFGFSNSDIVLASNISNINVFDYTTGTDKNTIMNKASGYSYSFAFTPVKQTSIATTTGNVDASTGLQSGDTKYNLALTVSQNGCDTVYTKTATIKAVPLKVSIAFATDSVTQQCSSSNYVNFIASDSTSVYKWYKNDVLQTGTSFKNSIEVFKSDGTIKVYAVPYTKDGYAGNQSNILYTQKRYITADVQLDSKTTTICSAAGEKIDVYSYLRGSDVNNVAKGMYGYSYTTAGDCGLVVTGNRYIDVDNSLSDDATTRTVSYTISQNGCTSTQTKTFIIKQRPKDITLSLTTKSSSPTINLFCTNDTLNFVASTSDASATTYNWYKNGTKFATTTAKSLNYPFTDSGTIGVYVQSVYTNGCVSTPSDTINVNQKVVNFNISLDPAAVAYCPGGTQVNMFDYVSGTDKADVIAGDGGCSYTFSASGNNGLSLISNSYIDLDNSKPAAYTLTFDVNKNGCSKSFTKSVTIKSRPLAPTIVYTNNSDNYYCVGDAVSFKDTGTQTGIGYIWNVDGTENKGGNVFTTTGVNQSMAINARAYYTANNCQSKASNSITINNVLPAVSMHLLQYKVSVNDSAKLYISEPVASKSISLTATRKSDGNTTNIVYKRSGNIITLLGTLTPGEYKFTGVAENSHGGYCPQNIVIDSTLTVTSGNTATSTSTKTSELDNTVTKLYEEYMAKVKAGEVHALLQPVVTSVNEAAKLYITTTKEGEYATIRVYDLQGKQISAQSSFLTAGENIFTIDSDQKPAGAGVYLVKIDYQSTGKSETIKGIVK